MRDKRKKNVKRGEQKETKGKINKSDYLRRKQINFK